MLNNLLEQIKLIEAEVSTEEEIHPDDLYFVKLLSSGKVLKRSFKKSLNSELPPVSKLAKLDLINHWNRQASGHTPPTYLYWL